MISRWKTGRSNAIVRLIGVFKLFKAILLILAGITALKLMHKNVGDFVVRTAEMVHVDPNGRHVQQLLSKVTGVSPRRFEALGAGAFLYATLFLVEGIGLLLVKRWAEYVAIISTAGLIPLEIYEIVRHLRWIKIVVLIVNIAIVVYLIIRVRSNGTEAKRAAPAAAAGS